MNDEPLPEPLELPRDHRMRVGVAWREAECAIPFALVRRLAAVSGVTFYALQCELASDEENGPFIALPEREDPLGAACLTRALDLVISVDGTAAHLAGALGVPVWTLLPVACGWEDVIARVVADLRALARRPHTIRVEVHDGSPASSDQNATEASASGM